MEVKEVHAIRLKKGDIELKEYLSQFPLEQQTGALRELINYGISSLKKNFQMQQSIQELQEIIFNLQKEQDRQFQEILQLLKQSGTTIPTVQSSGVDSDNNSIDIDKVTSSMQEALSMFME